MRIYHIVENNSAHMNQYHIENIFIPSERILLRHEDWCSMGKVGEFFFKKRDRSQLYKETVWLLDKIVKKGTFSRHHNTYANAIECNHNEFETLIHSKENPEKIFYEVQNHLEKHHTSKNIR